MNFSKLTAAVLLLSSFSSIANNGYTVDEAQFASTYGTKAILRLNATNKLVQEYSNHSSEFQKVEMVNSFFNQFTYSSDSATWGQDDYWSNAVEFMGAGTGDCEDFAIAKYQTLVKMGVGINHLRLVYVKSLPLQRAHMVLAYYSEQSAVPFVLDSLSNEVLSSDQRKDLLPVYSFNAKGLWLQKTNMSQSRKVGSAKQLSMWMSVENRSKMRTPRLLV